MADVARQVRDARQRLGDAGKALRAMDTAERAEGIARAAASVGSEGLAASTGLSKQGVAWGLSTTLGLFERAALESLAGEATNEQEALITVVLAGNVFTACARPLLLPLLCGVPVLVKASSRDDGLPQALQRALAGVDGRLGAACEVLSFEREAGEALLPGSSRLNVYGSDETIAAFVQKAGAARVIGHGHGLGLAWVPRGHATRECAGELALDIAAYDQRGCLSPHAVYVQGDADAFAARLHDALGAREHDLPRGRVPDEAAAELVQWRGVATAIGEVYAGETHTVSVEPSFRPSPGYRHVQVIGCPNIDAFRANAKALGHHLKAIGTPTPEQLAALAPHVCNPGEMQCPPLRATLDGLPPLEGVGIQQR